MQDIYEDETYAAWVRERLDLALLRLKDISAKEETGENLLLFFKETALWILGVFDSGRQAPFDPDAWTQPEQYSSDYDNPAVAVSRFGPEMGRLISWLSYEVRMIPQLLMLKRDDEIAAILELMIESYGYLAQGELTAKTLREAAYWYLSDYCDIWLERYVKSCLDPGEDVLLKPGCLPETEEARWLAAQMDRMSQETIEALAREKTEDFIKMSRGPDTGQINVRLITDAGSARLVEAVKDQLGRHGYQAFGCPEPLHGLCRTEQKTGMQLLPAGNRIREDHREDLALFLDGALCDRICKAAKAALTKSKDLAGSFAGTIDLTMPRKPFLRSAEKNEAARFNARQRQMIQKIYTAIDNAVDGIETI